ncbi:hypothetical protein [Holdemanella biformis]|uniref:hypothetical protein n=2 Tax=Holdemanella biformis TaxID=1735 RepID=UPI0026DB44C4|nr:hypothetical protein [Holdemanella biformis]
MVNLRHSDNIFYDREGDLFVITTDLDGRQEVVCKTNLECVSDVIARLLDINFKKVCDSENRLNMLGDLEQFACVYALKLMTYKTVKGLYLEFPTLAKYQGTALISPHTVIDNRNDGYNNKYHLMLVNVIYTSLIHATVKYAGSSMEAEHMKDVFETVLSDNKGLIETLNDFYDGAINEADLTDIIKNIQSDNTTKA